MVSTEPKLLNVINIKYEASDISRNKSKWVDFVKKGYWNDLID